jgi:hypothetical protein
LKKPLRILAFSRLENCRMCFWICCAVMNSSDQMFKS